MIRVGLLLVRVIRRRLDIVCRLVNIQTTSRRRRVSISRHSRRVPTDRRAVRTRRQMLTAWNGVGAVKLLYTQLLNHLCKPVACTYVLGKSRSNTALGAGLVGRCVRVHGRVLRRLVEIQVWVLHGGRVGERNIAGGIEFGVWDPVEGGTIGHEVHGSKLHIQITNVAIQISRHFNSTGWNLWTTDWLSPYLIHTDWKYGKITRATESYNFAELI